MRYQDVHARIAGRMQGSRSRPQPRSARPQESMAPPSGPTPVVVAVSESQFAGQLARALGFTCTPIATNRHPTGEFSVDTPVAARCAAVLVAQATAETVHESLWETLLTLDAVASAGIAHRIVVLPRLPYGRGDRPEPDGSAVPIRALARALEGAGASAIATANLHSMSAYGVFRIPLHEVDLLPALIAAATDDSPQEWVAIAADEGRAAATSRVAARLGILSGFLVKKRRGARVAISRFVGPDLRGASCLLLDDEVCTGSTLHAAAEFVAARGAREVRAAAVHSLLTEERITDLKGSPIERMVVSDTVPSSEGGDAWLRRVSGVTAFAAALPTICPACGSAEGRGNHAPGRGGQHDQPVGPEVH